MRRVTCVVVARTAVVLLLSSCGGGSSPSPAPSPLPVPAPAPVPTPVPAPAPAPPPQANVELVSISIEPSTVESSMTATATVTLSAVAPDEGVTVDVSSSSSAARTPTSVTILSGQASVAFSVQTAVTDLRQTSTISASYHGTLVSTALTVIARPLMPSFTVVSPTRGSDGCNLKDGGATLDCDLSAAASQPRDLITAYQWMQTLAGHGQTHTLRHTSSEPSSRPQAGCSFLFISGLDYTNDSSGNPYVPMTISMYFETKPGEHSTTITRTVRVYPNRLCGYSF